ncbi:MAG: LPS export ABC transporter ATP-binding protein [Nitrospinae bacterium]|nr:LPS export ABC transporter ATP-binding protein [Nitrospinota bacterium]
MLTLKAQGLSKSYKGRKVVDNVDVLVNKGEVVGLLGPNGAGKTTTFFMIVGLAKPEGGSVYLDDEEITSLPLYRRANLGVGYLPQESSVFRKLTVMENIMAVLEMRPLSRLEMETRAKTLLEDLNIFHLADAKASALSGGERRRLEISRILALSPSFLLLDEPFAGIDPIAVMEIQSIISDLKGRGIGVLITDHNVRETLEIVDRAYIISEGRIIESGAPDWIVSSEKARTFYLGKNFYMKQG